MPERERSGFSSFFGAVKNSETLPALLISFKLGSYFTTLERLSRYYHASFGGTGSVTHITAYHAYSITGFSNRKLLKIEVFVSR